jgi:hypothetical protein
MSLSKRTIQFLVFLLILLSSALSFGEDQQYITQSTIDGDALGQTGGRITVNMAAGDENVQANAAAMSISNGQATATVLGAQISEGNNANSPDTAIARIGGNAFSNASGSIAINQASGQGNLQFNGLAMAIGDKAEANSATNNKIVAVSEAELGGVSTEQQDSIVINNSSTASREATVEQTAFQGARGIVQVNQLAGSRNDTANNVALRISLGAE